MFITAKKDKSIFITSSLMRRWACILGLKRTFENVAMIVPPQCRNIPFQHWMADAIWCLAPKRGRGKPPHFFCQWSTQFSRMDRDALNKFFDLLNRNQFEPI